MSITHKSWHKLGRILAPDKNIPWMTTVTGPSFAVQKGDTSIFELYITGRDDQNRSRIGKGSFDVENIKKTISVDSSPVFDLGELGCFDENGVSYPVIIENNNLRYMY